MIASWRGRSLLAAAAFLTGLAVLAPASLVAALIQRNLPPNGTFRVGEGSVWAGSGTLVLANPQVAIPFSWHFDAGALLRFRLGLVVTTDFNGVKGSAHISRRFGPVELRDTDFAIDLNVLAKFLPVLALSRAQGRLRLSVAGEDRLDIVPGEAMPVRGGFAFKVERLILPQWSAEPFGNYALRVAAGETSADFTVVDSSGLLKIEGSGKISVLPAREFSFSGVALPTRPGAALGKLLSSFGRTDADGRVRIEQRGPW